MFRSLDLNVVRTIAAFATLAGLLVLGSDLATVAYTAAHTAHTVVLAAL